MINSRDITDLMPEVAAMAAALVAACEAAGIQLVITSTYRDSESQDQLYSIGRTQPGRIVTRARGGQSLHNYGVAFDVVPVIAGKAIWNDMALWQRVGRLGESVGLEWAGRWQRFREYPHFQCTGGRSPDSFMHENKSTGA